MSLSEDPIVLSDSDSDTSTSSASTASTVDPVVINKLKKLKDEVDRLKAAESDSSDISLNFGEEDDFKGPPSRKRKSSEYKSTHVQQGTQTKISTLQHLRRQNQQIQTLKIKNRYVAKRQSGSRSWQGTFCFITDLKVNVDIFC
ncbi:uncharacterized protein LOC134697358 isoform X2 [Mytilus trossulus]|uniref:uncharacterized protein LOC134697358 isoform X2 n=1 Tax=Mytilus trossulus TaxID=6551 RepID=UPI00300669E5